MPDKPDPRERRRQSREDVLQVTLNPRIPPGDSHFDNVDQIDQNIHQGRNKVLKGLWPLWDRDKETFSGFLDRLNHELQVANLGFRGANQFCDQGKADRWKTKTMCQKTERGWSLKTENDKLKS